MIILEMPGGKEKRERGEENACRTVTAEARNTTVSGGKTEEASAARSPCVYAHDYRKQASKAGLLNCEAQQWRRLMTKRASSSRPHGGSYHPVLTPQPGSDPRRDAHGLFLHVTTAGSQPRRPRPARIRRGGASVLEQEGNDGWVGARARGAGPGRLGSLAGHVPRASDPDPGAAGAPGLPSGGYGCRRGCPSPSASAGTRGSEQGKMGAAARPSRHGRA
ncbi:hypothetical protein PAHAL_5G206600 [Panicum hallii]|jgi:hypothetical protein|uniref:Uncharacterized protein n=1 Tax=Panicum hallii TaxID=206008 RepID=A0A2S3HT10_9POAL|nr:hypothetical protein PAHAL_5G206600 [Panicum hallii]